MNISRSYFKSAEAYCKANSPSNSAVANIISRSDNRDFDINSTD